MQQGGVFGSLMGTPIINLPQTGTENRDMNMMIPADIL
jgi:hypothetical protein